MKLTRTILALHKATSTDDMRQNLKAIHFRKRGGKTHAIASDGHILIDATIPSDYEVEDLSECSLHVDDAKSTLSIMPKGRANENAFALIDAEKTNASGSIHIDIPIQGISVTHVKVNAPETMGPDMIASVTPKGAPGVETALTVDVAIKFFSALKSSGLKTVNVDIRESGKPLACTGTNDAGEEFYALLMPAMR